MARPREFDLDAATDTALRLFWEKGYEATSLTDLTDAIGINRPSFYAAFESKKELFNRVLDRYAAGPGAPVLAALSAETAREVVAALHSFYADAAGDPARPRGCLLVQGALACGEDSHAVRDALTERRASVERAIRDRFKRAKAEGDLGADASPADLARYVWTFCLGMAVQAAGGASRADLRRTAAEVLRGWPSK